MDDMVADVPVTDVPVVDTPPAYFGADGTLSDGWQTTLPEGYRDERSLATVKDAKVLAKMFVDTKRMVGKNKMAIPDETSPLDEWSEYYRHGGRPDTPDGYALQAPTDIPPEIAEQIFPSDRLSKWQERFYNGGVSKKAADAFIAEFAQDVLADYKNTQIAKETELADLKRGLLADWGDAFAQNEHLGNVAITEGSNDDFEFQQRLSQKFGSDPDFVRFAANLGAKFSDGKPPSYAAVPTPSDIQAQIDEIEANPLYLHGTHSQRMKLAEKAMALRGKLRPKTTNT